jgi:hypothetical protein
LRWKRLRLLLAMLLPLHAGFAQAAMVMPGHAASIAMEAQQHLAVDETALMPDGMPCHQQANPSSAPDQSPQHKAGCCDAGNCHCAAACGLPCTPARIAPQPGFIVPPFSFLSVPSAARPPDLRPPIF